LEIAYPCGFSADELCLAGLAGLLGAREIFVAPRQHVPPLKTRGELRVE
jgi:hypothetical protein